MSDVTAFTVPSDCHRWGFAPENDKMVFTVPSLRNIKKTGPYFQNGSVTNLDQAIRNMALHQRGVKLSDAQVNSIMAWMEALTGPLPSTYIKQPVLPRSTAETPRPSVD